MVRLIAHVLLSEYPCAIKRASWVDGREQDTKRQEVSQMLSTTRCGTAALVSRRAHEIRHLKSFQMHRKGMTKKPQASGPL